MGFPPEFSVRPHKKEFFIPAEHLANGTVSLLLHQCLVSCQCLFQNTGLLILGCLRRTIGAIAPALGQVEQHPGPLLRGKTAVQTFRPEGIDILGKTGVLEQAVHLLLCNDTTLDQQSFDTLFSVPSAADSSPGSSGLPPGRCKAGTGLGMFRSFKNTNAQILNVTRLPLGIVGQNRPAHRGNTNIQTNGIFHLHPSQNAKTPQPQNVVRAEL